MRVGLDVLARRSALDVRLVQLLAVDLDVAVLLLDQMSPGRPISRLTKTPPVAAGLSGRRRRVEDDDVAALGAPRSRNRSGRRARGRRTRRLAAERRAGAQCSVGSIELDGIRYGLTTHCLIASTIRIAPTIVTSQSIVTRMPLRQALGQAVDRVSQRTCSLRQRSTRPWSPDSSTSGTRQPRNSAGRV